VEHGISGDDGAGESPFLRALHKFRADRIQPNILERLIESPILPFGRSQYVVVRLPLQAVWTDGDTKPLPELGHG
jgi:hypothetical protein